MKYFIDFTAYRFKKPSEIIKILGMDAQYFTCFFNNRAISASFTVDTPVTSKGHLLELTEDIRKADKHCVFEAKYRELT